MTTYDRIERALTVLNISDIHIYHDVLLRVYVSGEITDVLVFLKFLTELELRGNV